MPEASDAKPDETTVEALQAALERERLRTREVDHRAKNSLQLVSSLLLLLGRRSSAPDTQRALKAMHQRVSAIAAVHREILGSADADRFNLTEFIREHVSALARAHGREAVVHLELDPVEVAAGQASPIALLVNELALNALDHGAAAGRPPEATIRLRTDGAGFALTVADKGAGLPPGASEGGGFGLFMVRLLAQQLGAKVAWEDAQPGLAAVVTVP